MLENTLDTGKVNMREWRRLLRAGIFAVGALSVMVIAIPGAVHTTTARSAVRHPPCHGAATCQWDVALCPTVTWRWGVAVCSSSNVRRWAGVGTGRHCALRLRGGSMPADDDSNMGEEPNEYQEIPTDEMSEDEQETVRGFREVERQYMNNELPPEARREFEEWMAYQAADFQHEMEKSYNNENDEEEVTPLNITEIKDGNDLVEVAKAMGDTCNQLELQARELQESLHESFRRVSSLSSNFAENEPDNEGDERPDSSSSSEGAASAAALDQTDATTVGNLKWSKSKLPFKGMVDEGRELRDGQGKGEASGAQQPVQHNGDTLMDMMDVSTPRGVNGAG